MMVTPKKFTISESLLSSIWGSTAILTESSWMPVPYLDATVSMTPLVTLQAYKNKP